LQPHSFNAIFLKAFSFCLTSFFIFFSHSFFSFPSFPLHFFAISFFASILIPFAGSAFGTFFALDGFFDFFDGYFDRIKVY